MQKVLVVTLLVLASALTFAPASANTEAKAEMVWYWVNYLSSPSNEEERVVGLALDSRGILHLVRWETTEGGRRKLAEYDSEGRAWFTGAPCNRCWNSLWVLATEPESKETITPGEFKELVRSVSVEKKVSLPAEALEALESMP